MKKILVVLLILGLAVCGGVIYLNKVFLPAKIKSLIIQGLQAQTRKKVALETLEFNIFKGLVLKNLVISDEERSILSIKEGSCSFIIWPFFKKQIVIPSLTLNQAKIFLERRRDNSLNLSELFRQDGSSGPRPFNIFIYKVNILNSSIDFQDDTFKPAFTRSITGFDLTANLSLPASLRFKFKGAIPLKSRIILSAQGEYKLAQQELAVKVLINGFSLTELSDYYKYYGVESLSGLADISAEINLRNKAVAAAFSLKAKDIALGKDKLSIRFNSDIQSRINYGWENKELKYAGTALISGMDILGLDVVGEIKDIKGTLQFDDSKLAARDLTANVLGLPVRGVVDISRLKDPLIQARITAGLTLAELKQTLADKFKLAIPFAINGKGNISLNITLEPFADRLPVLEGCLEVADSTVKIENLEPAFEGIGGRVNFTFNGLNWSDLAFKFLHSAYKSSGALVNFQRPAVKLTAQSEALKIAANFLFADKVITLSELSGTYLDSDFSLSGKIDTGQEAKINADISGGLAIKLNDLPQLFPRLKEQFAQGKPAGEIKGKVKLSGNIKDIKSCAIQAELSSDSLSLYGLNATGLLMTMSQQEGMAQINQARLGMYDGSVTLSGKLNLASENLPYWIDLEAAGIKIEKLKIDTPAKDKDIAGTISLQVKLNGFLVDASRMTGSGKISLTEGKLWELNLFKGLGTLIFNRDFARILFSEAGCAFVIQDKYVFTDNLKLMSNLAEISGSAKIGFDSSLNSELNVNILEQVPSEGATIKDIATAILGQAGKFGTIAVSGTLKEPKYNFKPAMANIVKSLKDAFFGK